MADAAFLAILNDCMNGNVGTVQSGQHLLGIRQKQYTRRKNSFSLKILSLFYEIDMLLLFFYLSALVCYCFG